MGNALYTKLLAIVSSYIGPQKATAAIGRQLSRCQATPDTVTAEDLRSILHYVTGATTLHLAPDKAKQQELGDKIKAMV